jgi:hypothetical protein
MGTIPIEPTLQTNQWPARSATTVVLSVTIIIGAYGASAGHLLAGKTKLKHPGSRCLNPLSTK